MWNPFGKKNNDGQLDKNQTGFLARMAMKKMEKMTPKQQMKLAQKMMTPENISKNKDKIMAVMEQMEASGQITHEQVETAKKQFGL